MTKAYRYHILLILLSIIYSVPILGQNTEDLDVLSPSNHCVDSIMDNIFFYAPFYRTAIQEYDSDLYVKTNIDIIRKNFGFRYLPQMFKPIKGVKKYIVESYNEIHYTAPNIYDQKIKAVTGTTPRLKGVNSSLLNYFHINIYAPSFLKDKLVSPINKKFSKYYKYTLEEVYRGANDLLEYKISFQPKNMSYQLIKGYFIVSDKVWSIREVEFSGRSEYLTAKCLIKLGEVGSNEEFLPISNDIDITMRFLWNKVQSRCETTIRYDEVILKNSVDLDVEKRIDSKKSKYDLTDSYAFQIPDTTKIAHSYQAFSKLRFLPLRANERELYKKFHTRKDSLEVIETPVKRKSAVFWGNVGEFFIEDYKIGFDDASTLRFSPLINPFLLSYSGRDGLSYKYKIKYNNLFKSGKTLYISPTFGYNFKHKEFYWRFNSGFTYWPRKRGGIELNVENGNRIYSSEVLDDLKGQSDTINFNKFNLDYYKNMHINLMHVLEVTNGLNIDAGLAVSRRKSYGASIPDSLSLDDKLKRRYVSVAPRVRIKWTPGQYYYMNENRKINLYSKYPTLTLDWERSIKGFLGATGNHERLEMNLQHKLPLPMMRNLYYRLGGGVFSNQEQMYFVDFVYFAKNNLPEGWSDDIGGTFQLLGREWFNASQWYIRGNIVYEAPFLLLKHLKKYSRAVINERVYLNVLTMNQMKPYIEVGYGIGTHVFDFGVFGSLSNWTNTRFGCKITFELFNK